MAVSPKWKAILLVLYRFKAHILKYSVIFQRMPQYFAHTFATWRTETTLLLVKPRKRVTRRLECVLSVYQLFFSVSCILPLWRNPKKETACSKIATSRNPPTSFSKSRTSRSRQMWCCSVVHEVPFFIIFQLRNKWQHRIFKRVFTLQSPCTCSYCVQTCSAQHITWGCSEIWKKVIFFQR